VEERRRDGGGEERRRNVHRPLFTGRAVELVVGGPVIFVDNFMESGNGNRYFFRNKLK
jgi:hypothetical protein